MWCDNLVPRLVFLPKAKHLDEMRPKDVKNVFPNLVCILDATVFPQQKPENFLLNRLAYSGYKNCVGFQAVFGKFAYNWGRGKPLIFPI